MIKHTIRMPNGRKATKLVEVNLNPIRAIKLHCRECMGWPSDPVDCTSPNCVLFPFRTGDSHNHKDLSPQELERLRISARAMTAAKISKSSKIEPQDASEAPDPALDTLGSA